MKKIFVFIVATLYLIPSVVFAYGYPRFWKGDKNYPLVWGIQGIAYYLNKNSIKVKINDPPYYIITAETIYINNSDYSPNEEKYSNDKDIDGTIHYEFFYDEEETDMRIGDSSISNWRYLRPQGSTAESGRSMYVGEAVFYVVTGRKFYGNYLWKHNYQKNEQGKYDYWEEFGDDFYKDLR